MFGILLLLTLLPLFAFGFTAWSRSLKTAHGVTLATAVAHLGATFHALLGKLDPLPGHWWFALDPLGCFFLLIVSHTFLAVVLCSSGFLRKMGDPQYAASLRVYYPALNFYLLANTLVIVTQHFGLLWVVLELTTFGLAPLIYFYRTKESLEAAWKYLFLVSLGLVFLLIGILFLGVAAKGVSDHPSLLVGDLLRNAALLNPLWLKASFVFALVGVSAKIGLAPMHPADIDATSNAPAPVAALMSGSLRATALLVLLRFFQIAGGTPVAPFARHLLVGVGVFSLLVAAVYMWRPRNYKRLLSYSSVEHLGIITLAVGTGGAALLGGLLHTLFNSLGKIALFAMAGRVHHAYGTRKIDAVRGLTRRMPWTAFVFGLAFFYMVGTPPFGLFFSELFVLRGMVRSGNWLLLGVFLVLLMVIFIGMGRAFLRMLQTPSEKAPAGDEDAPRERFGLSHAVSLYAMAVSVPITVFQPEALFGPLRAIVEQFGHAGFSL